MNSRMFFWGTETLVTLEPFADSESRFAKKGATASWSAPDLRRFRVVQGTRKAPEGWSTPGRCRALE